MPCLCVLYPGICLTTEEKAQTTSVRLVEKCPNILVAVLQYTFTRKQYTEYTEWNIHNSKNKFRKCGPCLVFVSYTMASALQLRKKLGKT
jgi:hypothetical protein